MLNVSEMKVLALQLLYSVCVNMSRYSVTYMLFVRIHTNKQPFAYCFAVEKAGFPTSWDMSVDGYFGIDWFGFGFLEELPYSLYSLPPATIALYSLPPVTIGKEQSLFCCAFHDATRSLN